MRGCSDTYDVLLLDDFAMAPLKDAERRDFLEIRDDRYQRRSLMLTSQMAAARGDSSPRMIAFQARLDF